MLYLQNPELIDMKRLFLLTAILAVFGLSSCEKNPLKPIVGTWETVSVEANMNGNDMILDMANVGMELVFTFNEDGTGSAYVKSPTGREDAQFEYDLKGNILYITMDGTTDPVNITLEETTMTMEVSGELIGDESANITLHLQKI